jgi:hypothetical protein
MAVRGIAPGDVVAIAALEAELRRPKGLEGIALAQTDLNTLIKQQAHMTKQIDDMQVAIGRTADKLKAQNSTLEEFILKKQEIQVKIDLKIGEQSAQVREQVRQSPAGSFLPLSIKSSMEELIAWRKIDAAYATEFEAWTHNPIGEFPTPPLYSGGAFVGLPPDAEGEAMDDTVLNTNLDPHVEPYAQEIPIEFPDQILPGGFGPMNSVPETRVEPYTNQLTQIMENVVATSSLANAVQAPGRIAAAASASCQSWG